MQRKQSILARAFEQTYKRSIIDQDGHRISSAIFGFMGGEELKNKKDKENQTQVVLEQDRNLWNRFENAAFFLPRLAKNTAKLFTEFMWHAAAEFILAGADKVKVMADDVAKKHDASIKASAKHLGLFVAYKAVQALSLLPRAIALIGQSITSPIAGVKDTYDFVLEKSKSKYLAGIVAGVRGLFSMALYATISVFAFPLVLPALGSTIGGGLTTAMTALANTPVIGPAIAFVGSAFTTALTTVASFLGLTIPAASLATAGIVAGTTLLAVPAIAGIKKGLRALSPFKSATLVEAPVPPASPESSEAGSEQVDEEENRSEHDETNVEMVDFNLNRRAAPLVSTAPSSSSASAMAHFHQLERGYSSDSSESKAVFGDSVYIPAPSTVMSSPVRVPQQQRTAPMTALSSSSLTSSTSPSLMRPPVATMPTSSPSPSLVPKVENDAPKGMTNSN